MQGFDDLSGDAEYSFQSKHVFSLKNNILCGITLKKWIDILTRHAKDIEMRYYFRVIFITILATISSILAYIENYYYPDEILLNIEIQDDPIIIIGHPRSGTTIIHNLLATDTENFYYCDTFACGFPSAFLTLDKYKYLFKGIIDKTRPMDNMPLTFELPGEDELATNSLSGGASYYLPLSFMRQEKDYRKYIDFNSDFGAIGDDERRWVDAFTYFLKKITFKNMKSAGNGKKKRLVLKSPVHTGRVRLLRKLFPRAHFIYIHRHPEAIFKSAAHMADSTYWFCYLNTPTNDQVTEFILWQFEYLWKTYNDAVGITSDDGKRRTTSRDVLEVSYDQLVLRPIETLQAMYDHVGMEMEVSHFNREVTALVGYRVNAHTMLPSSLKCLIRDRWSDYFETFDYK